MTGYTYVAEVRNDSTGQPVHIIFWEYQFTEIAHPQNVIRRQFLCGVKIKDGEKKVLSAFTTLGPSDVLTVESLGKPEAKLFEERVQINRIELSDGNTLDRDKWKYSDVKAGVDHHVDALGKRCLPGTVTSLNSILHSACDSYLRGPILSFSPRESLLDDWPDTRLNVSSFRLVHADVFCRANGEPEFGGVRGRGRLRKRIADG